MDDCENSYGPHQYVVSKSAYPCLSQIYMIKRGGRKIIIGENVRGHFIWDFPASNLGEFHHDLTVLPHYNHG